MLEVCAGSGQHTELLVKSCADVTATDISSNSLELLKQRFMQLGIEVKVEVADIEDLPFAPESFGCVVCAGGLSYGSNEIVLEGIFKVVKPGGCFICVDSLDNNFIYGANRFIHYLNKRRSFSTLKNMPNLDLLAKYSEKFTSVDVRYFGTLSWLSPGLKVFFYR